MHYKQLLYKNKYLECFCVQYSNQNYKITPILKHVLAERSSYLQYGSSLSCQSEQKLCVTLYLLFNSYIRQHTRELQRWNTTFRFSDLL